MPNENNRKTLAGALATSFQELRDSYGTAWPKVPQLLQQFISNQLGRFNRGIDQPVRVVSKAQKSSLWEVGLQEVIQ